MNEITPQFLLTVKSMFNHSVRVSAVKKMGITHKLACTKSLDLELCELVLSTLKEQTQRPQRQLILKCDATEDKFSHI